MSSDGRRIGVSQQGWLFDWETNEWIILDAHPNLTLHTDASGYPYVPIAADSEATPATRVKRTAEPGSGWYAETYWTHHDWDPDVENLVLKYEEMYPGVYLNTYYMHPPVYGRRYEFRSFDVWDARGRGWALPTWIGDQVRDTIMQDPEGPKIAWLIYRGWMWDPYSGWTVWDPPEDGSDPGHHRHIHVTYS